MPVGGDMLIPSRVVTPLLEIIEAARTRPGLAVKVNVVLDAVEQAQLRASSADGTTVGGESIVDPDSALLSVRAAAERIGCSTRAITKALTEHRLHGFKIPGTREWLIREHDLETWRYGGKG